MRAPRGRRFWPESGLERLAREQAREQQERLEREHAKQAALEFDARRWRALTDPRRHAANAVEALRLTARGAVEDWMELERRV